MELPAAGSYCWLRQAAVPPHNGTSPDPRRRPFNYEYQRLANFRRNELENVGCPHL
jgi:hypothetical protein